MEKNFSAICPPQTSLPSVDISSEPSTVPSDVPSYLPTSEPSFNDDQNNIKAIAGGTAGGAALLLGMAAALYVRKKMSARSSSSQQQDTRQEPDVEHNDNPTQKSFTSKVQKKDYKNPSTLTDGGIISI